MTTLNDYIALKADFDRLSAQLAATSRLAMAAADEIERLRAGYRSIQRACLDGTICPDVAWHYGNETLHDYCERILTSTESEQP